MCSGEIKVATRKEVKLADDDATGKKQENWVPASRNLALLLDVHADGPHDGAGHLGIPKWLADLQGTGACSRASSEAYGKATHISHQGYEQLPVFPSYFFCKQLVARVEELKKHPSFLSFEMIHGYTATHELLNDLKAAARGLLQ